MISTNSEDTRKSIGYIVTHHSVFFFFSGLLGMSSQDSYFYAAFVAIATVHVILGLFVYAAFTEGTSTSQTAFKAD